MDMIVFVNRNLRNKSDDYRSMAVDFKPEELSFDEFINILKEGHAFLSIHLQKKYGGKYKRNNDNFKQAELIVIDIDNQDKNKNKLSLEDGYISLTDIVNDDFIKNHSYLVYTTFNHKEDWNRFRIIFRLPEKITDKESFRQIASCFVNKYKCDPASATAVQCWFGNTRAKTYSFGKTISKNELERNISMYKEINSLNDDNYSKPGMITESEVRKMLTFIPKHQDYMDWLRCINAIGNTFDLNTAISIINEWSPGKDGEIEYKLKNRLRDISIGTLIHIAKYYGYEEVFNKNSRYSKFNIPLPEDCIFWLRKGSILDISMTKLRYFLEYNGFRKYWVNKRKSILIQIKYNVVNEVTEERIRDFIFNFIERELPDKIGPGKCETKMSLLERMGKSLKLVTSDVNLKAIKEIELNFLQDTKDIANFYFKNTIVQVFKDSIQMMDYSKIDRYVWDSQIKDRDFFIVDKKDALVINKNEYLKLLSNICTTEEKDVEGIEYKVTDFERLKSLICTIGYLLHSYKDKTNIKAIILTEERLSNKNECNGRTGKGLTVQGIRHLKKADIIDGKVFRFDKTFLWQNINLDTQLVFIDDINKDFQFEKLFSVLSEGITVEYKGQSPFFIEFEKSPKFIISTNYVVLGETDSYKDRKHEIEFSGYYSSSFTPFNDFGHLLFDDWDNDQWNLFFNFMLIAVQFYLNNGLLSYEHKNLEKRKLSAVVPDEFIDFIINNIESEKLYNKKDIFENFLKEYADFSRNYQPNITQKRFTTWLKHYSTYNNLNLGEPKETKITSDKKKVTVYYFRISKPNPDIENKQPARLNSHETEKELDFLLTNER